MGICYPEDEKITMSIFKANGGIFGGIKLRQFNYLLNTLISSLTKTSPPGLEPGTKP